MEMIQAWCSSPQWFVLGVVLAVLLSGGGCKHRTRSGSEAPADTSGRPAPKHVSWDARFTMFEEGRLRANLEAARMEQYRTSDSTYSVWRSTSDSVRVRVHLFSETGDSLATLTADSVVFQDQKGRLDAYRDVVVITESSKRLETQHLIWRQADRKIRTRRFVRVITPKEIVQGNGLVAEEDLETYQIGRFTAEVQVDEGGESAGENEK